MSLPQDENEELKQRYLKANHSFQRGEIHLKNGDIVQAELAFVEACRIFPEYPEHRALLAWTKFLNPTADRDAMAKVAEEVLAEVVEAKPDCARAHFFLGEIWKFRKELEKAEQAFRAALAADPNHPEAQRELQEISKRPTKNSPAAPRRSAPSAPTAPAVPAATRVKPAETKSEKLAVLMAKAEAAVETQEQVRPLHPVRTRWILIGIVTLLLASGIVALIIAGTPKPNDPDMPQIIPKVKVSAGSAPAKP